MNDASHHPIRHLAHVRICNPQHPDYGKTGTVVRVDMNKRKVWVSLTDGRTISCRNLSVQVVVPRTSR